MAKSAYRLPNLELQAKRVMLAKLTGQPSTNVPDSCIQDEFHKAFAAASLSARKQAFGVMFPQRGNYRTRFDTDTGLG